MGDNRSVCKGMQGVVCMRWWLPLDATEHGDRLGQESVKSVHACDVRPERFYRVKVLQDGGRKPLRSTLGTLS